MVSKQTLSDEALSVEKRNTYGAIARFTGKLQVT
jgi:hypothetical protein